MFTCYIFQVEQLNLKLYYTLIIMGIYHAYTEDWCPKKCDTIGTMWDDSELWSCQWLGDLSSVKGEKTWKFRSNRHDHWEKILDSIYSSSFLNFRTKDLLFYQYCVSFTIIFKYGKILGFTINIVVKPTVIIVKCCEDYVESCSIPMF